MKHGLLLLPVLLPLFFALGLAGLQPAAALRRRYCMVASLTVSAAVLLLLFFDSGDTLVLLQLSPQLDFAFHLDGFGRVFAALVAVLWPLTTAYALEYMRHEGGENGFFVFFLCSFGVVEGIALSANLLTLYTFYELLTLVTLPLVMHGMKPAARKAGKQYLVYSMVGAALVFVALILLLESGVGLDFRFGGGAASPEGAALLPAAFLLGFFGFGVKGAVLPFYRWLPAASVAPTPVTALLHAVAVVKSGAFSTGRLIFYLIGPAAISGTAVQQLALCASAATIALGSFLALRTPHVKRRLAYSTVANLSYIFFAFALGSEAGFMAGVLHMVVHAVGKINLFFCAGAVLFQTGREYLAQFTGLARRMPLVFVSFGICALTLAGIPPFGGFSSKWLCLTAAAQTGSVGALCGIIALALASLFSVLYLGSVLMRSCLATKEALPETVRDPAGWMTVPMGILSLVNLLLPLIIARLGAVMPALLR